MRSSSLVVCVVLAFGVCAHAVQLQVKTQDGVVEGFVGSSSPTTRQFLGIPFAAPPLANLRFSPPAKPTPWTSVLQAKAFKPSCLQNGDELNLYGKKSEDCLYLNVFSPSNATGDSKLPVMLWIYGGSFVHGGASLFLYHGEHLSEIGNVVVVTVNYRLGALGFSASDALKSANPGFASSGNYGLLDQQQAMKWVSDNIVGFGGDPSQVTIFGESAGSMSVCFHLVMPGSRGLFSKAIMESGPCLQGTVSPDATQYSYVTQAHYTELVVEGLGCNNTDPKAEVACYRAANASKITELQEHIALKPKWQPVVDGLVVTEDPVLTFKKGNAAKVPILIGTNTNEGTLFISKNTTAAQYSIGLEVSFGKNAPQVEAKFPLSNYSSPFHALANVFTTYFFLCPSRRLLNYQSTVGAQTQLFQYHFAHIPSWTGCPGIFCRYEGLGVYHTAELFFVWDNAALFESFTPAEAMLAKKMAHYWTSFATYGSPRPIDGAPEWPKYTADAEELLVLNTTKVYPSSAYRADTCKFWDSLTN